MRRPRVGRDRCGGPVTDRPQINVRLTLEERDAFAAAAEEAGLSVSEWARLVLRAAAGERALEGHLRRAAKSGR